MGFAIKLLLFEQIQEALAGLQHYTNVYEGPGHG